jgi:hypothetical protein
MPAWLPTFALPWVFAGAVLAAVAVTALHLLAVDRPPVAPFPPARFLAGAPARAVARQRRPRDLPLLACRVLLLLAAGAALAGVRWDPAGRRTVRLVVADRAAQRAAPAWARAAAQAGDRVVWVAGLSTDPGRALAAAHRAAAEVVTAHPRTERVRLAVRLPARVRDLAGWEAWRALWPGPVTVLPLAEGGWPAQAGEDGAAAAVLTWPRDGVPTGWTRLARPDSVGAVAGFGVVLVGPWSRTARWVPAAADTGATPVAWWSDGAVAAVEQARAAGRCTRTVAIPHPEGSDLLAEPAAMAFRAAMGGACGGLVVTQAVADAMAAQTRGGGATGAEGAPASAFVVTEGRSPRPWPASLGSWLWALALGALAGEAVLRVVMGRRAGERSA